MNNHTPPPWRINPTGIPCDGLHPVAEILAGAEFHPFVVAQVFHMEDAPVVAASSMMLDALTQAQDQLLKENPIEAMQILSAAIAKCSAVGLGVAKGALPKK